MKIGYTTFYIEANIVCAVIFLIMLIRSLRSVDRQIKQRVFDMVLVSFILYFFSDCYWILVLDDYLPKTWFSITFANTLNSVILSYIAYHWFLYVETSQDSSFLSVRRNRIRTQIPIFVFSGLILVLFIAVPDAMIVDLKQPSLLYYILFLIVPVFFVVLAAIKSLSRAGRKENYAVHGQYIAYGLFPLGVTFFGIIQTLWLSAPLFCFGCTITLLYVYMLSQDDMISQDPLTGLNNRAQLRHYVAREFSRSEAENTPYYVMMLDLDWFKQVNDRYGHAEGDRAIILAAKAICKACANDERRPFIARYGGDEFIIIVKTSDESEILHLKERISEEFQNVQQSCQLPYRLQASIGFARSDASAGEFQDVLNKADDNLYQIKKQLHQAPDTAV